MDIARDYELVACQYSVALFENSMTPKLRTAAMNACKASDSAAKLFFDIILSFYSKKNDIRGFVQEYGVLGICEFLCDAEIARQIFAIVQNSRNISAATESRKIGMLREVNEAANQCSFLEMKYGLKLLCLNQAIRFGLIEPMAKTVSKITGEIDSVKNHVLPWIPQTLDAAFRG